MSVLQTQQHHLLNQLQYFQHELQSSSALMPHGQLTRLVGMRLEAVGCHSTIGTRCIIHPEQGHSIEAEVVGFDQETMYLMCLGNIDGLSPGTRVVPTGHVATAPVGQALLGRIIDGAGRPLDGLGPIRTEAHYPLVSEPMNPLQRAPIDEPLDVGVRAINSLLTVGRGQRMGLFAGSGVGKSVLLSMMTRNTTADVIVVGLIGERGREVKEFIEHNLGEEGLKRSVIVAAPADNSPLMRLHGALFATSIAEYFRDQGAQVLLLMDSLTRFAQAQREIGLAIGEPPTTKGYPPSVFGKLSHLVERAGNAKQGQGSITAFYTVLVEGDDHQEPIADAARAILDGHIVLSRHIAEQGIYPAIDIESSVSRVLPNITDLSHQQTIQKFRYLYSKYHKNRDLITIGAYAQGSDPDVDVAIQKMPYMTQFLQQGIHESSDFAQSMEQLQQLFPQN